MKTQRCSLLLPGRRTIRLVMHHKPPDLCILMNHTYMNGKEFKIKICYWRRQSWIIIGISFHEVTDVLPSLKHSILFRTGSFRTPISGELIKSLDTNRFFIKTESVVVKFAWMSFPKSILY